MADQESIKHNFIVYRMVAKGKRNGIPGIIGKNWMAKVSKAKENDQFSNGLKLISEFKE
jgi:hypothetical protein